jgi:hypothetical protein
MFVRVPFEDESTIGRNVEIRSAAGIVYYGIVRSIERHGDAGELFELGSGEHDRYQRYVFVTDRSSQVREIDPDA